MCFDEEQSRRQQSEFVCRRLKNARETVGKCEMSSRDGSGGSKVTIWPASIAYCIFEGCWIVVACLHCIPRKSCVPDWDHLGKLLWVRREGESGDLEHRQLRDADTDLRIASHIDVLSAEPTAYGCRGPVWKQKRPDSRPQED